MVHHTNQKENSPKEKKELDRFHEIELDNILKSIASIENLRVQIAIFFGTINIGVLTFAISQEKASLIIAAGGLLIFMVITDIFARQRSAIFYFRGFQIRNEYLLLDEDFYLDQYYSRLKSASKEILNTSAPSIPTKALKRLHFKMLSIYGFIVPLFLGIVEITLGLILWLCIGWSFF